MEYTAQHKIGSKVDVNFGTAGRLVDLFVISVRFSETSVFYNLGLQLDNGELTTIEDISSSLVSKARSLKKTLM